MLKLVESVFEEMNLFERRYFSVNEFFRIFIVGDTVTLSMEDHDGEAELILPFFYFFDTRQDGFGHFYTEERNHQAIFKYGAEVF